MMPVLDLIPRYINVQTRKTGETEYVYANAGTNPLDAKDRKADADQLKGKSEQYAQAVAIGVKLDQALDGKELTFVGHSLGGGEAAANALATGRDAITFNAAALSDATKSNLGLNQSAKIDNYEVPGQIVATGQSLIGMKPEGTTHMLGSPFINGVITTSLTHIVPGTGIMIGIADGIANHLMGAVKKALGMKP